MVFICIFPVISKSNFEHLSCAYRRSIFSGKISIQVMYGCESWTVKKAEHWRTDPFELWCWRRLLRVPWTARRSNQSILKDLSGDFFGRNYAKAETPVLWPPHVKSSPVWKDSDAWRDWGQEEKGMTENQMAGWHHRLDGHEFEWTLGVGDGQGGLACCSSWGHRESDTTEWLNWTEHYIVYLKDANRVDLKSSYHNKKKIVTMCHNGCYLDLLWLFCKIYKHGIIMYTWN